jgi:glutamate/tyrosine decarboxylase-like PLP-dependent enzyme
LETARFNAPTGDELRVDLDVLGAAIARDRAAGFEPARVIGNAGTVNTGAIDDLRALADLAVRENLWFHRSAALVHGRLFPKSLPKIARKSITVSI